MQLPYVYFLFGFSSISQSWNWYTGLYVVVKIFSLSLLMGSNLFTFALKYFCYENMQNQSPSATLPEL